MPLGEDTSSDPTAPLFSSQEWRTEQAYWPDLAYAGKPLTVPRRAVGYAIPRRPIAQTIPRRAVGAPVSRGAIGPATLIHDGRHDEKDACLGVYVDEKYGSDSGADIDSINKPFYVTEAEVHDDLSVTDKNMYLVDVRMAFLKMQPRHPFRRSRLAGILCCILSLCVFIAVFVSIIVLTSKSSNQAIIRVLSGNSSKPTTTSVNPKPTATLLPAIHWDNNIYDVDNLIPQDSSALYYAETDGMQDPYVAHRFLNLKVNFSYPTVVLEHCAYAILYQCSDNNATNDTTSEPVANLNITFTTEEAWQVASNTWTSAEDLVLVLPGSACNLTDGGSNYNYTRTYWKVSSNMSFYQFQSFDYSQNYGGFVVAHGDPIVSMDGLMDGDLVWGTYTPSAPVSTATATPSPITGPGKPNFDYTLDNATGFTNLSVTTEVANLIQAATPKIPWYDKIKDGFEELGAWVEIIASDVMSWAEFLEQAFVVAVDGGNVSTPDFGGLNDSWGLTLDPSTDSFWGPAFLINAVSEDVASLGLYCIDCGFTGTLQVSGGATFANPGGLTALYVDFEGSLTAGIQVGIDASAEIEAHPVKNKYITSLALSSLEIPNIILVGPQIDLYIDLDVNVTAEARIAAGADVEIGPFSSRLDFVNKAASRPGNFTPSYSTYFNATADVSVSMELGMPISLGIGVTMPELSGFSRTVALVDTPGIKAEAKLATSGSTETSSPDHSDDEEDCNDGIAWDINIFNDISANIFNELQIPIWSWADPDSISGCFQLNQSADALTTVASSNYSDTDAATYTTITGANATIALIASTDGNIHASKDLNSSSYFLVSPGSASVVYSDDRGRYLHYYENEMYAHNVSRMRLSAPDLWPSTAVLFGLMPHQQKGGPDAYVSVEDDGGKNVGPMPVLCAIEGQVSRFFAVRNATTGVEALRDPALRDTVTGGNVTGGNVTGCFYVPLNPGSSVDV